MADKLDWLNKHFVLLINNDVKDVIEKENYKLPFELRALYKNLPRFEDFYKKLAVDQKYKEASEILSYNIHHRALAWWAYCCVLSLRKEIDVVPAVERDISDIGKPKPFTIPDWAKEVERDEPNCDDKINELMGKLDEIKKIGEDAKSHLSQSVLNTHQEMKDIVYGEFKKVFGKSPEELIQEAYEKVVNFKDTPDIDESKSPIFVSAEELKQKIEKIRQNTIKTIHGAVPKKSPQEHKEETGNAFVASFNYVIAPTEENAKLCMELGNLCPDTPEGLLALVCFWSFGNLMPCSNQVVKTPNGLAANGFNSLLLMCYLAKGGTRNFNERVEQYFEIGKEVAFGLNNWSEYVKEENPTSSDSDFSGRVSDPQHSDKPKEDPVRPSEYKRFTGL